MLLKVRYFLLPCWCFQVRRRQFRNQHSEIKNSEIENPKSEIKDNSAIEIPHSELNELTTDHYRNSQFFP